MKKSFRKNPYQTFFHHENSSVTCKFSFLFATRYLPLTFHSRVTSSNFFPFLTSDVSLLRARYFRYFRYQIFSTRVTANDQPTAFETLNIARLIYSSNVRKIKIYLFPNGPLFHFTIVNYLYACLVNIAKIFTNLIVIFLCNKKKTKQLP